MIGYVLTAAFFYLLSNRKKHKAIVGKLPGSRITRGQLIKKIRRGEAGDINNGDLFYDSGLMYDKKGNIYVSKEQFKERIDNTIKNNQKHLRSEDQPTKLLLFDEYYGFDNYFPLSGNEAYNFTLLAIASGQKFLWEDQGVKRGLKNELFGKDVPQEKKFFKNIISNDGITVEELNERYSQTEDFRNEITEAIMAAPSSKKAKQLLNDKYSDYVYENIKEQIDNKKKNLNNVDTKSQMNLPFQKVEDEETPF